MEASRKGFTLVELLVVISIISILAVAGYASFRGTERGARDAKRRGDIEAISKAYEVTFDSVNRTYRPLQASDFTTGFPLPLGGESYTGLLTDNSPSYQICVPLESNPAPSCDTPSDTCFCRFSLQNTDIAAASPSPSGSGGPPPTSTPSPAGTPQATPTDNPVPTPTQTPVPTPTPCSILSAGWNSPSNPASEGTVVTLQAVGDVNCTASDSMAFDIRENDTMSTDDDYSPDPTPTFNNLTKTWTASWSSAYTDDSDDPLSGSGNEYFFNAIVNGGTSLRSSDPLLNITQLPPPDTTPPNISAVAASAITQTSATISWTTNEAATAQVEYGTSLSYGSTTTLDNTLVTSHSQGLSSLIAGTLYNYRVVSKDVANNTATSTNFTFTTATPAPTPTPTPTPSPTPIATSSPIKYPSTAVNDTTIGTIAWNTPTNVLTDNGLRASFTSSGTAISNYVKVTNYGFNIPSTATINGIVVEVKQLRNGGSAGNIVDSRVYLVKGGSIQTVVNKAKTGNWPTTEAYSSYGSSSDLWSNTWTPADINSANFGAVVALTGTTGSTNRLANVDAIRITVYYTYPAP